MHECTAGTYAQQLQHRRLRCRPTLPTLPPLPPHHLSCLRRHLRLPPPMRKKLSQRHLTPEPRLKLVWR